MTDNVSQEKRSKIMRGSVSKDTKPEKIVRSWLHSRGYRFRKNRKDLPGKPDIVMPRYKLVIFVHGCFWHQHACKISNRPESNVSFWEEKFRRNKERDARNEQECRAMGWKVLTTWECKVINESFRKSIQDVLAQV